MLKKYQKNLQHTIDFLKQTIKPDLMKKFKNILKNNNPFVIAELGAKYGDIKIIKKLIIDLKKSGADAVKIQTFKAKNLVDSKSVFYPNNKKVNQYKFFLKNQLSENDHDKIIKL